MIRTPGDSNEPWRCGRTRDAQCREGAASDGAKTMTAAQIARRARVSPHTVRYYTRLGLLTPHRDPANRYRLYSANDGQRVRFARRAQCLGYTLADVARILRAADGDPLALRAAHKVIATHLQQSRRAVDALAWFDAVLHNNSSAWLASQMGVPDSAAIEQLVAAAGAELPE